MVNPRLNAVVEVNPDAMTITKQGDRERAARSMHGIPVLLKEKIDTADSRFPYRFFKT